MAGSQPSLTERITPVAAGAHVTAVAWLEDTAAFALGDGGVVLARDDGAQRIEVHPGGTILAAAADAGRLVTGGDDGRVAITGRDGSTATFAEDAGAWIDAVALHPSGAVAWSAGRRVTARDDRGRDRILEVRSSARGLCFAPKGYRLAIAHYNGVTLWFPNLDATPEALDWKGSHLSVTWSPDGRFIITAMQENALHGWRLQPDKAHMRMTGYPSKTRSLSWSRDGGALATSGADAVIVWPFQTKDGPMGKPPRELAVRSTKVTRVAFHPRADVLAAGYADGCVLLVRLVDASELVVRPPAMGGEVTGLAWDRSGRRLAFGCEDGQAGLLALPT